MEAGPRQMAFVIVGRNLGAARLQHGAVAERAVADADGPGLELELLRLPDRRLGPVEDEDLAPARIDDRQRTRRAGGQRAEGRNAGDRDVERERQPARRGEPESQAGEAARPGPDYEPRQIALLGPGFAQQLVNVLEHADGPGDPFSQHRSVPHERRRGNARRGVKGESQHPRKCGLAGLLPSFRA